MSRRRREAMEGLNLVEEETGRNENANSTGYWSSLSLTQRWLALGVIAFISLGVLGGGLKYLEDSARMQQAKNNSLAAGNPLTPPPTPTPLPLSKEYIYSGPRLLAVKDAAVDTPAPSDLAVWRPSSGVWYVLGNLMTITPWGMNNDIPAPGDYDGDGKTDFCVFRPSEGNWYVLKSSDGNYYVTNFGLDGDQLAQADYDGDGKTDLSVFRASEQTWYVLQSSNSTQTGEIFEGKFTDFPSPADYDGDGKSDMAVWRDEEAKFMIWLQGRMTDVEFGQTGDKPVVGDYDGDGLADPATWRGEDNKWRIRQTSTGQIYTIEWGVQSTDIAVPADYDADGRMDIAIWRASGTYTGYWFILKSSNGQARIELWGQSGDIPVPSRYRR